ALAVEAADVVIADPLHRIGEPAARTADEQVVVCRQQSEGMDLEEPVRHRALQAALELPHVVRGLEHRASRGASVVDVMERTFEVDSWTSRHGETSAKRSHGEGQR